MTREELVAHFGNLDDPWSSAAADMLEADGEWNVKAAAVLDDAIALRALIREVVALDPDPARAWTKCPPRITADLWARLTEAAR